MKAKMMALAAVLLGAMTGFAIELPEFDAATITGDKLVALFAGSESKPGEVEYAELNRLFSGRELAFHDFVINGTATGKDFFGLYLSAVLASGKGLPSMSDGRFNVSLRFTGKKDIRFAKRVSGSSFRVKIKELSGVVSATRMSSSDWNCLCLDATSLVPEKPVEVLPEFDAATVTGAELLKIGKQLKRGMAKAIYQDLAELLLGREITFDDVQVIETHEREDGFLDIACCIGEPMSSMAQISPKSICLVARVPVKSIDALPWGFAGGMHIRHLTGRVAEPSEKGVYRFRDALALVDVTLDVAWKDESLPGFDSATISGDELVALISQFRGENAFAQTERVLGQLEGRRLTFSEGRVKAYYGQRTGMDARVTFGFGPKKKDDWRYACELLAVFPSDEIVSQMTSEQRVTNLSGVFAPNTRKPHAHSVRNGVERWHQLTDVTFDAEASVPLPGFDEKTIAGDELVKMVYAMPNNLSSAQLAELQKRLAGRRLAFHKGFCCGASGSGAGELTEASFQFGHKLNNGQYCEFRVHAQLREPMSESPGRGRGYDLTIAGTVADPAELGLEAAGCFILNDAEIK